MTACFEYHRGGSAIARQALQALTVLSAAGFLITTAVAKSRRNFGVNSHSGHHAEVLNPVELDADASSNDPYNHYLVFKEQLQESGRLPGLHALYLGCCTGMTAHTLLAREL